MKPTLKCPGTFAWTHGICSLLIDKMRISSGHPVFEDRVMPDLYICALLERLVILKFDGLPGQTDTCVDFP